MNRHPVKLTEVIDKQARDKEEVRKVASLLYFEQARDSSQHKGVIVQAVIAHEELEHDENGKNRIRPGGVIVLTPTNKAEQTYDREEHQIRKGITDVWILNESSKEGLEIEKTR